MLYDLYAVSNHYGSLNGGHYTACVKNQITGKWYNMNDSSCSEMQDSSEAVTNAAYLLFYKKRWTLLNYILNQIYYLLARVFEN